MKNKAHVWMCGLLSATMAFTSCTNFLEEDPKTFLSPSEYYTTENQIKAAVDGTYDGLDDLLSSDLEIATVHLFNLEYLVGTSYRPRAAGNEQNQFLLLSGLEESNGIIRNFWKATFFPLENCNSVIQNVSATDIISESQKAKYLGEAYFLRAYYYFQGVQLFGDIPLKTEPTVDLNTVKIPRSPKEDIYNQIVEDLKKAEQSGLDWSDKTGHVSMGAIKTLLAKVYLTMAGYPLQKGNEYYQLAYEKAKEVIDSGAFSLFADYKDLRASENENSGEHIFMIQREAQDAGAPFHFGLLPYLLLLPISVTVDCPLLRLMGVVWLLVKSFMKVMMTKIFVNGMRSFSILLNPNMVIRRQRLLWMFLIYANIGMRMPNLQERAGRIFRFTVMRTFY